jgi:prevent-host-death family protein
MKTVSFLDARAHFTDLCNRVAATGEPARIVKASGDVVMVAAEEWEALTRLLAADAAGWGDGAVHDRS